MDGLTNKSSMPVAEEEEPSQLYQQYLSAKPLYASKEEAIAKLTQELEVIAQRNGMSIRELLHRAEYSNVLNEDDDRARGLARTIGALKK